MGFSELAPKHDAQQRSTLLEFLDNIFHTVDPKAHRFFTVHNDAPSASSSWPYRSIEEVLTGSLYNTYHFCISTVYPDEAGKISRKREFFAGLHCVVLDDIGTKVQPNNLKPSFIIETSENNYQYGYILDAPITDYASADRLIKSIYSRADLTDQGGAMPNKLVKLPWGMNLKEGRNNFRVRVVECNYKRYSPTDLIEAWNLAIFPGEIQQNKLLPKTVFVDEILTYLEAEGEVFGKQSEGWVKVRCPLGEAHSDGDPYAGYSPLGQGPEPTKRQFKCFHSHDGSPPDTEEFLAYICVGGGPKAGLSAGPENFVGASGGMPLHHIIPADHFPDVRYTAKGEVRLKNTFRNLEYLLDTYGFEYSYNVISKKVELTHPESRMDSDGDTFNSGMLYTVISQCNLCCLPIGESNVSGYLDKLASQKTVNPVVDYLKSLTGKRAPDGKSWIEIVSEKIVPVHSEHRKFVNLFLRKWLIQCCAAGDGCERTPNKDAKHKMETMLVLAGGQGVHKTKFIGSLVPDCLKKYYLDGAIIDPSNKDSVMILMRHWIVETGELDATFRKSDIAHLKAFMSQGKDTLRPPYGRTVNEYARRTCFAATVNDTSFLADSTGNRRFWPLEVFSIELPTKEEVDGMWFEAWKAYIGGEAWWIEEARLQDEIIEHTRCYTTAALDPEIGMLIEKFGRLDAETMGTGEWLSINRICDIAMIPMTKFHTSKKINDFIKLCVPTYKLKNVMRRGGGNMVQFKMPKTNPGSAKLSDVKPIELEDSNND